MYLLLVKYCLTDHLITSGCKRTTCEEIPVVFFNMVNVTDKFTLQALNTVPRNSFPKHNKSIKVAKVELTQLLTHNNRSRVKT